MPRQTRPFMEEKIKLLLKKAPLASKFLLMYAKILRIRNKYDALKNKNPDKKDVLDEQMRIELSEFNIDNLHDALDYHDIEGKHFDGATRLKDDLVNHTEFFDVDEMGYITIK